MIDIIVPTYNRPEDIKKFVIEIQKQTYKNYHVIIIDDCSKEEIEHLIPKNNPCFTYIKLPKNKGQAFARNVGIEKGNGDIIVSLDDDAWFENEDGLGLVLEYFAKYKKLGCLMFDFRTPGDDYLSTTYSIKNDGDLTGSHVTCGCAYSRKALKDINGFGGYLHSGAEETDITLKLISKGYELRFSKKIKVFHNYIPSIRNNKWYRKLRFNSTRNDLMIVMMRYPLKYIIPYLFGKFFSHILFICKDKRDFAITILYTISAFPAALLKLPIVLKNRSAVSVEDFRTWLKLRW
jgi:glycosyltransferase involved in cell wall biosynthesis